MKVLVDINHLNIEGKIAWTWTADVADEVYSQTADFLESNLEIEITYRGYKEYYFEDLEVDLSKWESREGKIYFNTRELD